MHLHNRQTERDVRRELVTKLRAHGLVPLGVGRETPVHAGGATGHRVGVAAQYGLLAVGAGLFVHGLSVAVVTDSEFYAGRVRWYLG